MLKSSTEGFSNQSRAKNFSPWNELVTIMESTEQLQRVVLHRMEKVTTQRHKKWMHDIRTQLQTSLTGVDADPNIQGIILGFNRESARVLVDVLKLGSALVELREQEGV